MQSFVQYTPTKVVFGKDTQKEAGKLVSELGVTKVFLVYGGGSVIRSGLLDEIKKSLDEENYKKSSLKAKEWQDRLNTFIEDYKKNEKSEFEENEEEIIMKTKSNNKNKYTENKILYINKEKRIPTKLIIEDNNQKVTINIQYNKIEIN